MMVSLSFAIAACAVLLPVAAWAADSRAPNECPASVQTACPPNTTCCPIFMSQSGYGCCNIPNAVCCGGQSCCQPGYTCINTPPYSSVCARTGSPNASATQVCTPGAHFKPSGSLPNMIVIGDSVSIGYTPVVATKLSSSIFVQHSPWAGGGGADDIANGVNCEEYFLKTAMLEPVSWDLISFNFGLHNLDNRTVAEDEYSTLLTQFTDRLLQTRPTKLIYVTTTPYMPDKLFGNTVVEDLNTRAKAIMAAKNIPVADLYQHVIDYCGAFYKNCSLCDNEYNNKTGVTCGYHYTSTGYDYIASFLAPIYKALLGQ